MGFQKKNNVYVWFIHVKIGATSQKWFFTKHVKIVEENFRVRKLSLLKKVSL